MPDFSLPGIDGRTVTLSELKGRDVLLIFLRGKVANPDGTQAHWCQLCHYQYAELAELEKVQQVRKKCNVEILFVLPYDRETVAKWATMFPEQMALVDNWREEVPALRGRLPKRVVFQSGPAATMFPILYDGDQAVSKRLGLFSLEWDRAKVDQNVPTVFLVDKAGVIRFKYTSQNTFDRPSAEYLVQVLARMMN